MASNTQSTADIEAAKAADRASGESGHMVELSIADHVITILGGTGTLSAVDACNVIRSGRYGIGRTSFQPGAVLIDTNAHVGSVAVTLAKMHPHVTVIACEPISDAYRLLVENIERNGVKNVVAVNKAVTPSTGPVDLFWKPDNYRDDRRVEVAEGISLDDLFAEHGIERCAWLKLVSDGSEADILMHSDAIGQVDQFQIDVEVLPWNSAYWCKEHIREAITAKCGESHPSVMLWPISEARWKSMGQLVQWDTTVDTLNQVQQAGRQAVAEDRLDDAETIYREIVDVFPGYAQAHWNLGCVLGRKEIYPLAFQSFHAALCRDGNMSNVEFSYGGHVIRISDTPGSVDASCIMFELANNPYDIANLKLNPGDTVLDIGAHIGIISIVIAKLNPYVRIISFEPSPGKFECLVKNLRDNGITNVIPVNKAVAGRTGTLEMMLNSTGFSVGASYFDVDRYNAAKTPDNWNSNLSPCTSLDDVFLEFNIRRCAWIKLDCEGGEYDILGNTRILDRVDTIQMELHVPPDDELAPNACLEFIATSIRSNYGRIPCSIVTHFCNGEQWTPLLRQFTVKAAA